MTTGPVACRYFYGDYFRGKNKEACRLLEASPNNQRAWYRQLCDSCPVPEILRTSNSHDLLLEAEVKRKFLWNSVTVTFAVCSKHLAELSDPRYCQACATEEGSVSQGSKQ